MVLEGLHHVVSHMSEKFLVKPSRGVKVQVTKVRFAFSLLENGQNKAFMMGQGRYFTSKPSFLQEAQ